MKAALKCKDITNDLREAYAAGHDCGKGHWVTSIWFGVNHDIHFLQWETLFTSGEVFYAWVDIPVCSPQSLWLTARNQWNISDSTRLRLACEMVKVHESPTITRRPRMNCLEEFVAVQLWKLHEVSGKWKTLKKDVDIPANLPQKSHLRVKKRKEM